MSAKLSNRQEMRLREIAKYKVGSSGSWAPKTTDSLIALGFVAFRPPPGYAAGRSTVVVVTDAGRDALKALDAAR